MKAAFLGAAVLATAGAAFYFGTAVHAAKASGSKPASRKALASTALSLPLFFEPNQGQTAPQVKFLAHGAGYGLFLTADEAVLEIQHSAFSTQHSAPGSRSSRAASSSVIRMRLEGANASARISGASPLPGKSDYFIGNDPSKWHRGIPQFARVEYQAVYPGVDLVYYGDGGQLEYDFRVAPGAAPNQIALSFTGASAHIVAGDSGDSGNVGDLILSTANGDVRFHAPHVYQQDGDTQKAVAGSFRQLAGNKIGFTIGDYDHSRELVIDPILSYSTYLGGSGTEGGLIGANPLNPLNLVKIAIDPGDFIYVAGSTNSADFPVTDGSTLKGAQNIFISKINPSPSVGMPQLVYSAYLGGSGKDSLAGIAVDKTSNIYVAGSTTSNNFPTVNALNPGPVTSGTHGFLSALTFEGNNGNNTSIYTLTYSTYLAGTNAADNAEDEVTGLAIDSNQNAYVTGVTTSSNSATLQNPFPASPDGYQTVSNNPGNPQFFASQISTTRSGYQSMLYSTYFGGGYPVTATAIGGGIAVDPSPNSSPNIYITGATTMLGVTGPNGEKPFPLFSAQQTCLNEASNHGTCSSNTPTTTPDAFVAKISPSLPNSNPIYSTYIGGRGDDYGNAIAVDTSGNAYVTGATDSNDWVCSGSCVSGFQNVYNGDGNTNAFVVKISNPSGSSFYPLTYFTYLGGAGPDSGQDIKVDLIGAVHVVGATLSPNFPLTTDALQHYGGSGDAFVALLSTTAGGNTAAGDYSTYLGGSGLDQGTGIAFDQTFGAAYVAGITQSGDFPVTLATAYQQKLNGPQDAFVSKIGANSVLSVTVPNTSPTPNPVNAGTQVAFTFTITNTAGSDPASAVTFNALGVPATPILQSPATATVKSGSGSCDGVVGTTISCNLGTLAVNAIATVEVDMTPAVPASPNEQITISGNASANGGAVGGSVPQPVANVVDFQIQAFPSTQTINAGDKAIFQVIFTPTSNLGYNAAITPGAPTFNPSMVTASTPAFNPTSVQLSGSGKQTTALTIVTVPRPVPVGNLLRRGSFYATWLPIGGLSLVGLGIGAGRKRRRWLVGVVLAMIAGAILLQSGCGSASSSTTPNGGTQAGTYIVTISASPASVTAHTCTATLIVN